MQKIGLLNLKIDHCYKLVMLRIKNLSITSLLHFLKPNYSKKQRVLSSFLLTLDNIPVQSGHGVLSRLVLCILDMGLAYSVLNGHFGPVYLLEVSKNDNEEHSILK